MSYSSHILGYLYIIKGDTFIMNTKIDISKNMATQNSNFPILRGQQPASGSASISGSD